MKDYEIMDGNLKTIIYLVMLFWDSSHIYFMYIFIYCA